MTADRDLDRQLGAWFDARATQGAPAGLLERSLERVDTTLQRPGWLVRDRGRSPRTMGRPTAARIPLGRLVAIVAAIAVATGAGFFLRLSPATVGGPSSSPSTSPTPSTSVAPSSSPSPSPAATPRPPAVIAYIKDVYRTGVPMDETSRLWIVGADGIGGHELFPGGTGGQSGVAWSPDGTQLVYSERDLRTATDTGTHLYLTDASGSTPQLVDPGCVAPSCYDSEAAFSPDGRQLVFLRAGASTIVIATMDLATGRVVELGSTAAVADERPRWSPDGRQIVFSRLDKDGDLINNSGNRSAVFIVDADGRNLRQLSSATLPARLPDWSPDGSRIVFTSYVTKIVRVAGDNVFDITQDVYTVRPDWTDLRRLTTEGFSNGATWTPDGRIMFTRECTVQRPTGGPSSPDCSASGLWTMDADGTNARLLVPGGNGLDGFPLITPGMIHAAWQPTP